MPTPYATGEICTWHGPLAACAKVRVLASWAKKLVWRESGDVLVLTCPVCYGGVHETTREEWDSGLRIADKMRPGAETMMRWGQGRCFPDFDTLQNAWRQAMEE